MGKRKSRGYVGARVEPVTALPSRLDSVSEYPTQEQYGRVPEKEANMTKPENMEFVPKFRPTEGFTAIPTVEIAGWLNHQVGLEVAGRLAGWMSRESKKITEVDPATGREKRKVFYYAMIRVKHPIDVFVKDGEIVRAEPGQIVGMPLNASTRPLLGYVLGKREVWFCCRGRKDVGKIQPMFDYEILVEKGATPSRKLPPPVNAAMQFDFENYVYEEDAVEVPVDDKGDYDASQVPLD